MSLYEIEISSNSKVVLFQGSLKKAPQLNKRGRKKWNERFCVLRANKMMECFKTKKAMDSSKNPRKVIDLRECINLEVGLEYKDQQHIFSLGTFKRTFFFGAPSDALMLQWVDCIEKVKNATDKDNIKLLDIGLRKSAATPLKQKMKTSQSLSKIAAFSSSNISQVGLRQMNEVSFKKKEIDKVLMKEKRSPSLPPSSSIEATNSLKSLSSASVAGETSPKHGKKYRSEHKDSSDEDTIPRHRYYVNVSPRAPVGRKNPNSTAISTTNRKAQNDVKRHVSPEESSHAIQNSFPPEVSQKIPPPKFPRMRKGSLGNEAENNPFSALIQKEHIQTIQEKLSPSNESPTVAQSESEGSVQKPFSLGMKRSFRYRHITLKKEKPLLTNVEEEPSTDEETEDEDKPDMLRKFYGKKEFAKSSPNLTQIGIIQNKFTKFPQLHQNNMKSNFGVSPQTNYSKVTVLGVKVQSCTSSPTHLIAVHNKQIEVKPSNRSAIALRTSCSEGMLIQPSENIPIEVCEIDTIILPDRHPSDTFTSCDNVSISSLDDILVDPPEMFDDTISNTIVTEHTKEISKDDNEEIVNRNSTESNDTGYNSSPSYNQSNNTEKKTWDGSDQKMGSDKSVEKSYVCVPIVFYTKNIWKPKGRGKGLLGLQVCLVEQRSSIIQELLSLKELEGYSVIECEQEHGVSSAVKTNPGDTLVVETSLEDLEFGFSVVKSTQKDLFNRRVREFDFEVRNLFSSNRKPFSCEIHIKHASEVIVLPVEVTN